MLHDLAILTYMQKVNALCSRKMLGMFSIQDCESSFCFVFHNVPRTFRKKLRIYQGDTNGCISFDLSQHPGRGDGLKNDDGIDYGSRHPTDQFTVCNENHCHQSTVK